MTNENKLMKNSISVVGGRRVVLHTEHRAARARRGGGEERGGRRQHGPRVAQADAVPGDQPQGGQEGGEGAAAVRGNRRKVEMSRE